MKDIETLLESSGNQQPQRTLRTDFTKNIINHIQTHPRPIGWRERIGTVFTMKFISKPTVAIALIAATIGISGVAYAATNWPTISAFFSAQTTLASGNRIVGINTENCTNINIGHQSQHSKSSKYYEIKKDSTLTNEQVVDMVRGICEEDRITAVTNTLIKPYISQPGKTDHYVKPQGPQIVSAQNLVIKAITDSTITLLNGPGMEEIVSELHVTYTRLSPDLKVYDKTNPITYHDLKVGDSIVFIARDDHAIPSESDQNDPNHLDDPELIMLLAIAKVPRMTGSPGTFYKHFMKDFVRTEPCTDGEAGFCRAYDFLPETFQH